MSNPHTEAAKHDIIGSCLKLLKKKKISPSPGSVL